MTYVLIIQYEITFKNVIFKKNICGSELFIKLTKILIKKDECFFNACLILY